VDLILRTFTGQNLNFWTTDKYDVSKCEAAQVGGTTPPPPTESPPPPPPPPAGDPFQQNKETLALLSTLPAAQWQGATSGSCFNAAGAQVSAVTNRSELSAGVPLTVCSSGCNTSPIACKSGTATLNPNALNTLLFLAQEGVGFTVTSISTGSHSPTSQHYALRAVDISAPSVSYSALSAKLQTIPAVSKVICENSSGETACTDSSVNHIHFEVR
ncbi:MAG: hypothetical protein Q8R39_03800, partial [bacterium]|nr:hypothetical protein [bacterium]